MQLPFRQSLNTPLKKRLLILLIIFLLHSSYLFNTFTWLDHLDIEQKKAIAPIEKMVTIFSTPFSQTTFYRPMVTLFHSLDHSIYSSYAPGYHLTNLLLFLILIACTPAFMKCFVPLTQKQELFIILILGIHPLTWLPVGAISYRPELLFTLFSILTVTMYAQARNDVSKKSLPGSLHLALTALFGFCAFFSKESAIYCIPVLLLFWEVINRKKVHAGYSKVACLSVLLLTLFIYLFLRHQALPDLWSSISYPLSWDQFIGVRLYTLGKHLLHLPLPLLPQLDDAIPIVSIFHPFALISLLSIISVFFFIKLSGTRSSISICIMLTLLLLLPALNIISLPRFYSPHYAFIAVVPFVTGITLFITKKGLNKIILFLTITWIVLASIQTFLGGLRFYNDYTLFYPEVVASSNYNEGNLYLGRYYAFSGDLPKAEKAFANASIKRKRYISYDQEFPILFNLSTILIEEKKYEQAESVLNKLEKVSPKTYEQQILGRKALLYSNRESYDEVIKLLKPKISSLTLENLVMLAEAYHHTGQKKEAIDTLKRTLLLLPQEKRNQMEVFIQSQTATLPN